MTFTDEQLDRYARHIVLPEIGGDGQARLLKSHVAIVGAGGIGSPLIQYLAAAGVATLTVIDDDTVSLSNLQRQTLYGTRDVGAHKAAMAANAVARLNRDVQVLPIGRRVDAANADLIFRDADVVVDGSDSFETRLLVADACQWIGKPLVSAAVGRFEGQLAVYRGWEADKPCYRCLVGADPGRAEGSCADQGVLGALTGVMGSLAAIETIRQLVPFGEDSAGKLLLVDALAFRFRTILLPKDPACRCAV